MIRDLRGLLPDPRPFDLLVGLLVVAAVLHGVVGGLLIGLLTALLAGELAGASWWLLGVAVAALAHHAVLVVAHSRARGVSAVLLVRVQAAIGEKLTTLPGGWFAPARPAEVAALTTKTALDVANAPVHLLGPVVTGFVTPATVAVIALTLDWRLGVVLVAGAPLFALGYRLHQRIVERDERVWAESTTRTTERVLEFADQQPVLRAFAGGPHRPLADALTAQRDAMRGIVFGAAGASVPLIVAIQAVLAAALAVGAFLAAGQAVDAGLLVGILVLAVRFAEPLTAVADVAAGLRMAGVGVGRVQRFLATPTLPEPVSAAVPGPRISLELRNVDYGYAPDRPVLHGVSLVAEPGSLTAVVGSSGAGKSTLLKLIARADDPWAGAVLLGGADLRALGTAAVLDLVSVVDQEPFLLAGTLEENVRMGRHGDLDRVAAAARVDEIVERLPHGWATPVGEAGGALSRGERQRVAIARALLRDTPVVLLDEVTSALDATNERLVGEAVAALARDRVVVVVAHRLQTVLAADRIVVLDDGRIADVGAHSELRERPGRYRRFVESRTAAVDWSLTRDERNAADGRMCRGQ
ncbi:ABC transporter ATP-binding protein [Pseudonocardia sp. WMMC193]|uniref:ABC transporter ATP-binding protein n=1 Tax=Pseudonocardia sp. WMMC193 TaxID=2911965 RepID=UPI001F2CCBE5|nr:ABC transporter ATP-binding protein [Pseudonocardia sp. WMMC193]MCF7553733.1 ABC transporter ATP-binding protein/permease [Pseudonocardia sp. WMMC193]